MTQITSQALKAQMIDYAQLVDMHNPTWTPDEIAEDAVEEMCHRYGREIAPEALKHYEAVKASCTRANSGIAQIIRQSPKVNVEATIAKEEWLDE